MRERLLRRLARGKVEHTLLYLQPDIVHVGMPRGKLRQKGSFADADLHMKRRRTSEHLCPPACELRPVSPERRYKIRVV